MNRVVIVTGGTSGIGLETAKKFLCNDDKVVVASLDEPQKVEKALKDLAQYGSADFIRLDISSEESCESCAKAVWEKYKRIDVLANVAGITQSNSTRSFFDQSFAEIKKVVDVNLMGTIMMSMITAKHMAANNTGVIINVSSIAGFLATSIKVGYSASKAGINQITKIFAKELAPYGIRCVAVAPATVRTGLMDPAIEPLANKLHMKNRIIEPQEIASAIYLLSLDAASAVNGITVMTDDGYCALSMGAREINER